jgi:hypothetical protein
MKFKNEHYNFIIYFPVLLYICNLYQHIPQSLVKSSVAFLCIRIKDHKYIQKSVSLCTALPATVNGCSVPCRDVSRRASGLVVVSSSFYRSKSEGKCFLTQLDLDISYYFGAEFVPKVCSQRMVLVCMEVCS